MIFKPIKGALGICCIILLIYFAIRDRKKNLNKIKDKSKQKEYIILSYLGAFLFFGVGCLLASLSFLGVEVLAKYDKYVTIIIMGSASIGLYLLIIAQQIYIKDMQKQQDKTLIPEIKKWRKNCIILYLVAIIFGATAIFIFIH